MILADKVIIFSLFIKNTILYKKKNILHSAKQINYLFEITYISSDTIKYNKIGVRESE